MLKNLFLVAQFSLIYLAFRWYNFNITWIVIHQLTTLNFFDTEKKLS